ncbi:MAG: hypothetical protein KDA88_23600 [Planctomycetaceae bacterium]|nr:hypothetical protein [Planctomycetaceae bacterium]MCB9952753.1 hypothetical protein [Planctomycetaceae bacterium]
MVEIELENLGQQGHALTFRVAFHSASQRWLLRYPVVTDLKIEDTKTGEQHPRKGRRIVSEPRDDFVLIPGARISFDLKIYSDDAGEEQQWMTYLPAGSYTVRIVYSVDDNCEWHDYLQKRSRFVEMTPIWRGLVESNPIDLVIKGRP